MPPLKRHPALVPLSKDHHFGLLLCWKIRQGLTNAISEDRIADYAIWFFDNHLKDHFSLEEKYVFTLLAEEHPLIKLAKGQHVKISNIIDSLQNKEPDAKTLKALEEILEQHIRMEERELFQELQNTAGFEKLLEMEARISNEHHQGPDDWKDPFWLIFKKKK